MGSHTALTQHCAICIVVSYQLTSASHPVFITSFNFFTPPVIHNASGFNPSQQLRIQQDERKSGSGLVIMIAELRSTYGVDPLDRHIGLVA